MAPQPLCLPEDPQRAGVGLAPRWPPVLCRVGQEKPTVLAARGRVVGSTEFEVEAVLICCGNY